MSKRNGSNPKLKKNKKKQFRLSLANNTKSLCSFKTLWHADMTGLYFKMFARSIIIFFTGIILNEIEKYTESYNFTNSRIDKFKLKDYLPYS